jgi:hypothetical protein
MIERNNMSGTDFHARRNFSTLAAANPLRAKDSRLTRRLDAAFASDVAVSATNAR